jgi:hypothetical protein
VNYESFSDAVLARMRTDDLDLAVASYRVLSEHWDAIGTVTQKHLAAEALATFILADHFAPKAPDGLTKQLKAAAPTG